MPSAPWGYRGHPPCPLPSGQGPGSQPCPITEVSGETHAAPRGQVAGGGKEDRSHPGVGTRVGVGRPGPPDLTTSLSVLWPSAPKPDPHQPPALKTLPPARRDPRPQGHGYGAIAAQDPAPPPRAALPPGPSPADAGTPGSRNPGARGGGCGARPPSAPQDRPRGSLFGRRGRGRRPGGRASLPGAEVSARGTGGAGAGGFISGRGSTY